MTRERNLLITTYTAIHLIFVGCATTTRFEPSTPHESAGEVRGVELPAVPDAGGGESLLAAKATDEKQQKASTQKPSTAKDITVIHSRLLPVPDHQGEDWLLTTPSSALDEVWDDYTNFEYENVIAGASRIIAQRNYPNWERAMALLLAGASSYLLGDAERALTFFVMGRETDPSVRPAADQFPAPIIQLFNRAGGE